MHQKNTALLDVTPVKLASNGKNGHVVRHRSESRSS